MAVVVALLSDAVIVALPLVEIVPAAAVNVAVVELAAIVTDAGTVKDALLDARPTEVFPLRAALLSVTVHVVLVLELKLEAVHWTDDKLTGA